MVVIMKQVTVTAFGMIFELTLIYSKGEIKLYENNCDIPLSTLFIMNGREEMELSAEDSMSKKIVKQLESENLIQEIPHHYGIFRKFRMLKDFL